jgi:hypothetical protein
MTDHDPLAEALWNSRIFTSGLPTDYANVQPETRAIADEWAAAVAGILDAAGYEVRPKGEREDAERWRAAEAEAVVAVLDLLVRAVVVTEDETDWREHAEGIRAAVTEGGLALAIQREMDFEATLEDPEFTVADTYGEFPTSLLAIIEGADDAD